MAKLTLSTNNRVVSEHPVDKEQITIGRQPDNDIQIDNRAVSGHHARILTIVNDSFLQDNNSTNGIRINGITVTKQALRDGDVITIGQHTLTYANELVFGSGVSEFEQTMVIRPDAGGMPEKAADEAVDRSVDALGKELAAESEAQQPLEPARVQVVSGTNAGRELVLTKALTTLGKPGVQVAAVARRPQGYYLIPIETRSGKPPSIDGEAVAPAGTALTDGCTIEVAGVTMKSLLP